jgi:leucyl-tRNA synthetase
MKRYDHKKIEKSWPSSARASAGKQKEYDHRKLERKWQVVWDKQKLYKTSDTNKGEKMYVLDMFPYPSGDGLHVGHPRGYIATDVYSRMKKMEGYNVLHPMGWDAFGLPAENFAIKNKVHPSVAVSKNVKRFKEQLSIIGFNYDWSREIDTTDPEFYKWTQWIFLQMYKKGLAYESHEPINWCPGCKTGLANEDVENDGTCERCGTKVEQKPMRQWVLKITDYADRMLADLDKLPKWPEGVKEAQRNWIGKSEGLVFTAPVKDIDLEISTFSAHFEACYADTFVVIAPDHPLLSKLISGTKDEDKIKSFCDGIIKKRSDEKANEKSVEGIFTGRYIVDPLGNGDLPIWVASFALKDYGTGIVKCSAHDERDFAFAKKYNIPLKEVMEPLFVKKEGTDAVKIDAPFVERNAVVCVVKHWKDDSYLCLKWKKNDWQGFVVGGIDEGEQPEVAGAREVQEETGYKNLRFVKRLGGKIHSQFYHQVKKENRFAHFDLLYFELTDGDRNEISESEKELHDVVWVSKSEVKGFVSKDEDMAFIWRRFIEPPFPFTDAKNGILTEPNEFKGMIAGNVRQEIASYLEQKGFAKRKSTYRLKDWVFSRQRYWGEPIPIIHCEKCKVVPVPEKDLPVILPKVKSYEPTGTGESPLADIAKWVNVKCPNCKGPAKRETNTMPQWAGSSWYYLRYIDPKNKKALVDPKKEKHFSPVDVYVGGDHATRHLIYARFWHKFLYDINVVSHEEPFPRLEFLGFILAEDGRKMSKRWKNIVNPDDVVKQFGADAFRLYEMFIGPFESTAPWSTNGLVGTYRFVEKVVYLSQNLQKNTNDNIKSLLHKTIKKVGEDIENFKFNTAVSSFMIFMNEVGKDGISKKDFKLFLQILAPFAPHITEELWHELGEKKSIHLSKWPIFDESLVVDNEITIGVQVNGKVRGAVTISKEASEEEVMKKIKEDEQILKYLTGEPKRIIYIKGKIINVIV